MLSPSGGGAFPAKNSPQRLSNDAKSRAKIALKPGRSLMDWIRLSKSGKDLQGFAGKYHTVTKEELAKHDKETDCWMAIRGKVYNITPYLEFHPGGIPEILRGVGQDGTDLFDEVHKWVNVESMLVSCLVGPLSASPKLSRSSKSPSGSGSLKVDTNTAMPPPNGVVGMLNKKENKPRYDWFQNEDQVFLSVYTKNASVVVDDVIVDCEKKRELEVKILLGERYYTLRKELAHSVDSLQVKAVDKSSGKVEIVLTKEKPGTRWETLGCSLDGDETIREEKNREPKFRQCILKSITRITHDTCVFGVQLPDLVSYRTPIGHHCLFKTEYEGMEITRSYTVAMKTLVDKEEDRFDNVLYFMIKIYDDGIFTRKLGKLKEGDLVTMSDCTGDFKLSRLKKAKDVFLIAAGTGLTPMLRIIAYCLKHQGQVKVKLLFANKTEGDILWQNLLNEVQDKNPERFSVTYVLSRPSTSWEGLRGRIDKSMVQNFVQKEEGTSGTQKIEDENSTLACVCGPTEFTHSIKSFLVDLKFSESRIHCFLG